VFSPFSAHADLLQVTAGHNRNFKQPGICGNRLIVNLHSSKLAITNACSNSIAAHLCLFMAKEPLPEPDVALPEKIPGQRTMTINGLSFNYPVFSQ